MFASAFVGLTFCLTLAASSCQSMCVGSVGFSAGVSGNQGRLFETGVIVAYNKVYTNEGLGYNNSTGVFTAPKGGLYEFQFQAITSFNNKFWLQLYHNGEWLVSAFALIVGAHAHAANSIVLKLKQNDQVYIKSGQPSNLHCLPNEVYATFSGYLVGSILDYCCTE